MVLFLVSFKKESAYYKGIFHAGDNIKKEEHIG